MSCSALLVHYFATRHLFGQLLYDEECDLRSRLINTRKHIFFRPIISPKASLAIHIWIEFHSLGDWPAYCCIYDKYGRIVNPSEDDRFFAAFTKHFSTFPKPPAWVNCQFGKLIDLIDFLNAAHI